MHKVAVLVGRLLRVRYLQIPLGGQAVARTTCCRSVAERPLLNAVLPKSALGNAILYTLKNWDALCRYTEAGYLEPDNNYADRCLRPVALGRKNFLFVGSERAGRAAAIYYSLVESCKVNKVDPLTYMTYVLSNVPNRQVTLLTPDEFGPSNLTQIG
jgi:transposase